MAKGFGRPRIGLSSRLILVSVVLVSIASLAVGFFAFHNLQSAILPSELSQLETVTRRRADEIESFASDARAVVLSVRGSAPVGGVVRALAAGGFDRQEGSTADQWKRRLSTDLQAILAARPDFYQFRLIGVANNGREIVRVDRMGSGNTIRVVQDSDLQEKGGRAYFKESAATKAGQVYTSAIELNRENGKLETPHVPVMRVATPVHTDSGDLFGILIINIDLRPTFAKLREHAAAGATLYVIDSLGNYLVHPDPTQEFSVDLEGKHRWFEDFPGISLQAESKLPKSKDFQDKVERIYEVAVPVQLSPGYYVAVLQTIPHSMIMAPAQAVLRAGLIAGSGAILIAILLAALVARGLTHPLKELTQAVERFDGEHTITVPSKANGEVGTLAHAFEDMTKDIRDKTQSLKGLYEMEKLYGSIVESSADAIMTISLSGEISAWNAAAEKMFGYSAEEVIGKPLEILVPEDRKGERRQKSAQVPEGERIEHYETVRLNKLGRPVIVSITESPIYDANGKVVSFSKIVRDITEQKKLEERLRIAQRMEAVGTLASGIAHDFNNILTAISGNARLAREDLEADHTVQKDLDEIEKASARGASVVRQILKITRSEEPKSEQIDIESVVTETVDLLRATKPDNIQIDSEFDPNLPAVLGDSSELHQVMMNLCVNAFHAMREKGGQLEIRGTSVVLDDVAASTFPNLTAGRYVRISVSDTGGGMDHETMLHIFEPFFTTKSSSEGTGLGLSVVYGVVERHGGAITAYSELGKGTMFRIYLPAQDKRSAVEKGIDIRDFRGNGESIMYVDDDEALVLMFARMLRRLNYDVAGFQDPQQALSAFIMEPNRFDVVITDMSMPHIDGPEFVRQLFAIRPEVPVVMVTGYIRPEDTERTKGLGIQRLILKPNTVHDMGQAVHEILAEIKQKQGSS